MPFVKGKTVVVFGDSLSAGDISPGAAFANGLRQAGARVVVNAKVGRSAWNFYKREDAAAQLAAIGRLEPDLVVVVLGTNDIGLSLALDQVRMAQLRVDLERSGAEVYAFGPPAFALGTREESGSAEVMTMMHTVFGDRLFDLRPLTADMTRAGVGGRSSDGVHFTAAGGKAVGDRMAKKFLSESAGGSWAPVLVLALFGYLLLR